MIGVIGSTGQVGAPLMEVLTAANVPVKALAHSPESAQKLSGDNVQVVIGDVRNDEDVRDFMQGVTSLFMLTPPAEDQVEVQNKLVDAAVESGVDSIVKLSVYTAADDSPCGFSRWHVVNDRYIAASGLDYTILHPHSFMQSMAVQFAGRIRANGIMEAAVRPDAGITMIDVRDVGAVAAQVLLENNHQNETILITGPEEVTYSGCAAQVAEALDTSIEYRKVSVDEARANFVADGVPGWVADSLVGLHFMYDTGLLNPRIDTVRRFTGLPARTFSDYLADNLADWR